MVSSVGPFGIHGDGPESGLNPQGASICEVFFFCHFPIRFSGSGVILIVSIPDICVLPHFLYSHEDRLARNTVNCAILSDQIVVQVRIQRGDRGSGHPPPENHKLYGFQKGISNWTPPPPPPGKSWTPPGNVGPPLEH